VHQGDRLLDFSADPAAVLAWDQAVSALTLARQQQAHTAELLAQQLATKAQLADANKAVRDAEAALEAQRRSGGDKQISTVIAPFDGIVTDIPVARGDRIQPGAPLVIIVRTDSIAVTVGVELTERPKIHPNETVELQRLDGSDGAATGTVRAVGAMLNPKTRLVDVVVSITSGSVVPGENLRALITVGVQQGWLAPRGSVLADGMGSYVFQVVAEKAVRVGVRIIAADGDRVILDGPLDPNRPLVTQGNYQLDDGAAIRESGGTP
jgi:membrane fusion protein (multidrug efflux system)